MKKIWVEHLRALSLAGVIIIHSTSKVFKDFGNIQLLDWWTANVLNTFFRFAVPMFVMISGCVLLGRNIGVKEFYMKRGIRLLPGFIFWSCLYIVFACVVNDKDLSIFYFLKRLTFGLVVSGKTWYHLWYLSMFICLMIFAPFINNYIVAKKPETEDFYYLFLTFAIFMTLNQLSSVGSEVFGKYMNWFRLFPWYITYFIMGYFIDAYNDKIPLNNRTALLILSCLLPGSCILNLYLAQDLHIVKDSFVLSNTGILNFIATLLIFYLFSNNREKFSANTFICTVASKSFGIYLVHPLFIDIFRKQITPYIDSTIIAMIVLMVLTFIFSFFTISALTRLKWFRILCQ
jgi:surface polysaccharide O-acyltransferase-like enzyme